MPNLFYQQYGFDVEITLDSDLLDTSLGFQSNGLCDKLIVGFSEGNARVAKFSFIPPESSINLEGYQGKKVTIKQRNITGWHQIFDGWVDIPSIEFKTGKVTLECTDRRQTRIETLAPYIVGTTGSYSEALFGTAKDSAEELEKRLTTIAGSFDFDGYGNHRVTSWSPKATADFTLTPADIQYDSEPSLDVAGREKTTNTINLQINYRYQRLHQQACHFTWTGFQDFISSYWDAGRPSFPAVSVIDSAIHTGEWKPFGPISITPIWAAQGFAYGPGYIMWEPDTVIEEKTARLTFDGYLKTTGGDFVTEGNPPRLKAVYKPVLDANGEPVMDVIKRTVIDNSSHLCRAASWTSVRKFAQTVNEQYNITLRAPQGITKNRPIPEYINVSIDDPFNTTEWENNKSLLNSEDNVYINEKNNYSKLFQAIQVALNKARHDILKAHRDVTLTFRGRNLKPRPDIDLHHTVDVTIDNSILGGNKSIHAKGKVYGVTHEIDFNMPVAFTVITLKLSRMEGSASNSTWAVIEPAEPEHNPVPNSVNLLTHIALDPEADLNYATKTGWFCNAFKSSTNGPTMKTTYPERFVVDYPEIPASLRDELTVYSNNNTFDLVIPNDTLEVHT